MIPVNDAIVACVTGMLLTAGIVVWACRAYWRARADDAYQDGHSAGIETQIGRQQRARARGHEPGRPELDAYLERVLPPRAGEPVTDVIVADITTAAPGRHRAEGSLVIPFPEGLPPDLRDWVMQSAGPAPPGPPATPSPVRGEASLRRLADLTSPHTGNRS